jgi:acetyl-CoA C-acetyltransferase
MSRHPNDIVLRATRTPTGKFQDSLSSIPAPHFGAIALKAALERAGIDPSWLSEVIMGNVVFAWAAERP